MAPGADKCSYGVFVVLTVIAGSEQCLQNSDAHLCQERASTLSLGSGGYGGNGRGTGLLGEI